MPDTMNKMTPSFLQLYFEAFNSIYGWFTFNEALLS
jgi:hypothetical protein